MRRLFIFLTMTVLLLTGCKKEDSNVVQSIQFTNVENGKLKLSGYAGPVLSFGLASTDVTRIKAGDNWAVEKVNNYNGNSRSKTIFHTHILRIGLAYSF